MRLTTSARNRSLIGALVVAYLGTFLVNAVAGHGPVDGWLNWGVLVSALLLMTAFVVVGITRQISGRSLNLDNLPVWMVRLVPALTVALITVAVTIALTR